MKNVSPSITVGKAAPRVCGDPVPIIKRRPVEAPESVSLSSGKPSMIS